MSYKTIEQQVLDIVERYLAGPPEFAPGSMAGGSQTEERMQERWAKGLQDEIAKLKGHRPSADVMLEAMAKDLERFLTWREI